MTMAPRIMTALLGLALIAATPAAADGYGRHGHRHAHHRAWSHAWPYGWPFGWVYGWQAGCGRTVTGCYRHGPIVAVAPGI